MMANCIVLRIIILFDVSIRFDLIIVTNDSIVYQTYNIIDSKLIKKKWLAKTNLFLNLDKTCVVSHALIDNIILPTETKINIPYDHCTLQVNTCCCELINIEYNYKYFCIYGNQ